MSLLPRIKKWLFDTWKVSVSDEWLSACWEWIHEQQEDRNKSFESQCGQVFDQWLVSDLREIGASCFPQNLDQYQKHFLPGIYVVQIHSLMDIGLPFYKQIEKLKGPENENALVDASTQATQSQREASGEKHTRMMMMMMSDGKQEVKAIELNPIFSINHNIPLGTKAIIHGGVFCRMGVLLLKAENLSVLGGEVEGLVEQSTQLKTIEDKLASNIGANGPPIGGQRTQPPSHHLPKKVFTGYSTLSNNDLSVSSKPYQKSVRNDYTRQNHDSGCHGSFTPTMSQIMSPGATNHPQMGSTTSTSLKRKHEEELFSDDDEDLIFGGTCEPLEGVRSGSDPFSANHDDEDEELMIAAAANYSNTDHGPVVNPGVTINPAKQIESSWQSTNNAGHNKRIKPSLTEDVTLPSRCVEPQRPFVYIRDVLQGDKCGKYFIKGYISTVVGKLEHDNGRSWSINVRLDDGSATLVVQLRDELLTTLIGFSAQECKEMRKRIKAEPSLKNIMAGGVKKCQESLMKMYGIFELDVTVRNESSPSPSPSTQQQTSSSAFPLTLLPTNDNHRYAVTSYRKVTREDLMMMKRICQR